MTKREELKNALEKVYKKLYAHEKNIKVWEMEYQKAIKSVFPDMCWWEVTDCDIFMSLYTIKDPAFTMAQILNDFKLTEV